jgi:glycerol uptake facilitator-like aquaporin
MALLRSCLRCSWEAIMTFVLLCTVYACGVNKPGHGSLTPLAVGLVVIACIGVGECSS